MTADEDDDPKGRHRRDDWDTSEDAAESQHEVAKRVRALVLATHLEHPAGLTDEELADLVNADGRWGESSPRKRRGELADDGLIVATALRRPSRKGKQMIVWIAVNPDDETATVPTHRPETPREQKLRAALTEAIVASLRDPEGCGSDLGMVGEELEDDTWLYVTGNLDVHHLVSDVLTTIERMKR